MIFYMFIV